MKKIPFLLLTLVICFGLMVSASAEYIGIPVESDRNWDDANDLYYVPYGYVNDYHLGYNLDYHMYDNGDGSLSSLIVSSRELRIYIETYDLAGNLVGSRTLPMELPIFGAFLAAEDCFYIAYGQENREQDDSKVTWSIAKYDRNWNKLAAYTATGGETDTTVPFKSSIAHMALSDDGSILILYAGKEWYADGNGICHQSNTSFVLNTADMTANTEFEFSPEIISHSFCQLILFDGDKVVTIDQNDTYRRCFYLQTGYPGYSASLLSLYGSIGDTITNAMGSGFEKSEEGYLFLACTAPQDGNPTPWNVFLRFIEKKPPADMPTLEELQEQYPDLIITIGNPPESYPISYVYEDTVNGVTYYFCPAYGDRFTEEMLEQITDIETVLESAIHQIPRFTVMTPVWLTDTTLDIGCARLVKMSDNSFVVMWGLEGNLFWQCLNGRGEPVGETRVLRNVPMPPTQPVVVGDTIRWLQELDYQLYLFTLDPTKDGEIFDGNFEAYYTDGLHPDRNHILNYYEDGKINTDFTGIAEHQHSYYYVENGTVNYSFTGKFYYQGIWYCIRNGQVYSSGMDEPSDGDSGYCGYDLTWTLTFEGTLTISGTGAMTDYISSSGVIIFHQLPQWALHQEYILNVIVEEGVTHIGDYAFFTDYPALTELSLPASLTSIGTGAFTGCTSLTDVYYAGTEEMWNAISIGSENDALTAATIHFAEIETPTILNGLVLDTNGIWWYYVDGVLQTNYTGLVYFNNTFFYVQNGMLDTSYVGLVEFYGAWYYVEGGIINFAFSGLCYFNGTFFYIQNGVLDTGYVGLVEFYGAWYYVEGGIINFAFTGLTYFNDTFFYIQNGVLDTSYVGLVEFYGAWYYIEGGIINFNFSGLTYFNDTFFYIQNGVLDTSYVGLVEFYDVWYFVQGGIIDFSYSGVAYTPDGTQYNVIGGIAQP